MSKLEEIVSRMHKFFIAVIGIAFVGFSSCKKVEVASVSEPSEVIEETTNEEETYNFEAKINGEDFIVDDLSVGVGCCGGRDIIARNAEGNELKIAVDPIATEGTYNLEDPFGIFNAHYETSNGLHPGTGSESTITVLSVEDGIMTANFHFASAGNTYVVSEGWFSLKLGE